MYPTNLQYYKDSLKVFELEGRGNELTNTTTIKDPLQTSE